jgi:hypothetical protein
MPVAADGFSFRRLSAGRASWNDCAPGGGNYLQNGGGKFLGAGTVGWGGLCWVRDLSFPGIYQAIVG